MEVDAPSGHNLRILRCNSCFHLPPFECVLSTLLIRTAKVDTRNLNNVIRIIQVANIYTAKHYK